MKTIEEILVDVVEDKKNNLSTTSFQFKKDLWDFFKPIKGSEKWKCVEFGTHKGQTTRVLSYLFEKGKVYTINLPGHMDAARVLNQDRNNIVFEEFNLYTRPIDINFEHKPINVFFIDAVHTNEAVLTDFSRVLNFNRSEEAFVVFDDYGLETGVFTAVEQLLRFNQIEKIQQIGHPINHSFGGFPERRLKHGCEGLICKIIND